MKQSLEHRNLLRAPARRTSTDRLLALGMALHADRRTMESRVRGIFARKRSARFARVLAALLCLALGLGCFTTACIPAFSATQKGDVVIIGGADGPTEIFVAEGEGEAEGTLATAQAPAQANPLPAAMAASANPIGDFVESVQPAPFTPVTAPSRVIRNPQSVNDGVLLTYDADVTVPQASAYSVVRMAAQSFSDAELARLRTLFDVPENAADGQYHASKNGFYYNRYQADVTRKTWIYYELDWQPDEIALFDEPIPLSRTQTQPIAEKALLEMGAKGYVLDSADEAIAIGRDAQGTPTAISKGWEYVFVPQSNGLPRHAYSGWSSIENDPICYYNTMSDYVWIYVDEAGVSRVSWHCFSEEEAVVAENVALISLDEVIALANARFALIQRNEFATADFDIRVQNIRLAAMLLGNDSDAAVAYSVPVWEVEYSISYGDGYRTLCVLPFNAVDGGAVMQVDFPF